MIKRKLKWLPTTLCGMALALLVTACGEDRGVTQHLRRTLAEEGVANFEKTLLDKLHASNLHEVATARLAKDRAADPRVGEFAEKLIQDHQAADVRVRETARDLAVELAEPSADHSMPELEGLRGAEFDKAFAALMVKDHEREIADLKAQRTRSEASRLVTLIDELLPTLESHLDIARSLSRAAPPPEGDQQKPEKQSGGSIETEVRPEIATK